MKPVWKWVIGIVATLFVVVLLATWYLSRNWKPIVETKLQEMIHNSSNGLYELKYDNLDLNLALGNVTLENAELVADTAVYQQLVADKNAPNNRFHIQIDLLKIRRVGILDILFGKNLRINNILLESPSIHMINEYHAFNDTLKNEEPKTLYDNIKDALHSIHVKNINLNNVNFQFTKIDQDKKRSEMKLDSLQIKIHDILVDETSINDTTRTYYAKMLDVQVPGFEYDLPDGFYKVKFNDLRVNTQAKNLLLTAVSFAPKMSKSAFFKQKNMNVTMTVLNFDTLRLENMDFKRLVDKQQIIAKGLLVKNGSANMYMDKRFPRKPGTKIGKAPHQQLMKLKQVINIDTVYVDNVDVLYGEFSAKFHQEGIITFNGARGTLTNVTNDTTALRRDKWMRADLRAKIMDSGNLHAQFGFDMLSKNGVHTYKGSLGAMKAPAFNRILKPLLNVEIASGNIRKINFDMQGTDYRNWGDFRFDYDDLKIRLLNEKGEDGVQTSKRALSFIVNQVLINDSNPDANEVYHVGKITNYKRDPYHSFFKTLWQSLLEGIKQCAGISPDREARLMGTATKAKDTVEDTKSVVKKTGNFIKGIFKKKEKEQD